MFKDQIEGENFQAAIVSAWEIQTSGNAFQSDVPGVFEKRFSAGWTNWKLRLALVADAVTVLAEHYGWQHVFHADWTF